MNAHLRRLAVAYVLLGAAARPAAAEQSIKEVLSFLLINRSIPTDDFARDEQAAIATRDAISLFLLSELATLPFNSPASGFVYRLDRAVGVHTRSSDSFAPFFVDRSLTGGRRRASIGVSFQQAVFDNIDGRNLRDGTLVATAGRVRGDTEPFDIETLSVRLQTRSVTVSANVGLTDRLDVNARIPFVTLALSGERIDTYRGAAFPQAAAVASASGVGDLIVRTKYNLLRRGGSGLSVAGEAKLPTGEEKNLLGDGQTTLAPRVIGSLEGFRLALHGDIGYAVGGHSHELKYGVAVAFAAARRLTLVGEFIGRRIASGGRLTETSEPHPRLIGIDTIRLTSAPQSTERMMVVAGLAWNIAATTLLSVNTVRSITTAGLNAGWVSTVMFDYAFRR